MSTVTAGSSRTCSVCKRVLPIDRFSPSGHGRRTVCTRCFTEHAAQQRRARGAKIRHQRYNARGHVWCNRCERYLPSENFKRHPSRPTYWSYCKECTRDIDRERYAKKTSTLEGAMAYHAARNRRKRRQRSQERGGRREFVAKAIALLQRKGFTITEISRLADVHHLSVAKWKRANSGRCPLKAVEERFAILVRVAGSLPDMEPRYKHRIPHPEFARIHAITIDEVRQYHVRGGKRGES